MSKDPLLLVEFAEWLRMRALEQPGRFLFLTLTFDRYRKYYPLQSSDARASPNRNEVRSGLTLPMPAVDARQVLVADLDRFYCFLLRELFGKRYCRHFERQPVGIGALDEPRYKGASKRSPLARHVGDTFDHAHFALLIPEIEMRGRSMVERFIELVQSGRLQCLWRCLNREGEVHVSGVFDLLGALDYACKTAKLQAVPADELLLWPTAIPRRSAGSRRGHTADADA